MPALGMLLGTVLLLFQAAFPFFGAHARSSLELSDSRPTTGGKLIMLVVDALSVPDFTSHHWPNLRRIAAGGAIGLMNTRTAGPNTPAAAHATMGAGTRARAGTLSGLTFNATSNYRDTPVLELYESITGHSPEDAASLFLGVAELRTLATMASGSFSPGLLGQMLADSGIRTAVIGNADVYDEFRRHGALIAVDAHGRIPFGNVGREMLTEDINWPFRLRTDYDATWDAFVSAYDFADFLVIELGDFARLDVYANWITTEQMNQLRYDTFRRVDEFIGRLHRWPAAAGQQLLLVSPSPPSVQLRRGFLLAPVMWATLGEGTTAALGPKLITSNTTRRAGIVTNTDIAPTVLAAFDLPSASVSGTAVREVPLSALSRDVPAVEPRPVDPWAAVQRLYERTTLTNSLRGPVVQSFVGFSIAVFVAWVAWMTYLALGGVGGPEAWLAGWRWMLLLLMVGPLAILVLPLTRPPDATWAMVALGLLSSAFTWAAYVFRRKESTDAFVALALLTTVVLVVDVLLGAPIIKNSILGYDPIVAARFYGIGNEYMGVLIGTTLIGTTGLLDRWALRPFPRRSRMTALVTAIYAVIIVVLASPSLGANVGGTIAAVIGFGTTLMMLIKRRLSWKIAFSLLVALAAVLFLAALADVTFNREQPSHLGRALMAFVADGWQPLATIAARKLSMNLRLLRWTIWAQVFVVSLAISAIALYRPGQAIRRADQLHPNLLKGIRGAVVAALAALIANDSGVVAAATLMIPATATLMYLVLLQRAEVSKA